MGQTTKTVTETVSVTDTMLQATNALAALIIGRGWTPANNATNARAELRFGTNRRAVWITEDAPSASTWRTE
jgi:hypothetical protein